MSGPVSSKGPEGDEVSAGADRPYIEARGLSLATRRGPVFTDLSFALPRGALGLVAGRSGTGRSTLLLAIAGRMRGLTGELRVARFDHRTEAQQIRATTAVARIATFVSLEGQLSVADSITERALLDGVAPRRAAIVFGHAETMLDRGFARDRLVDDLTAADRTLLAVALAALRPAHVIVLDDADQAIDAVERRDVYAALRRVTQTGVTVVASVLDASTAPPDAHLIELPVRPDHH